MAKVDITAQRLRELLNYDPETGRFAWNVTRGRAAAGSEAGCGDRRISGLYVRLRIDGTLYLAQRLAWLYVHGVWPEGDVDHINGITADNRIHNLRDVPHHINLQNRRSAQSNSSTGVLGVRHAKQLGRYIASIQLQGEVIHIGVFSTIEAASTAYLAAKRKLHEGCTI